MSATNFTEFPVCDCFPIDAHSQISFGKMVPKVYTWCDLFPFHTCIALPFINPKKYSLCLQLHIITSASNTHTFVTRREVCFPAPPQNKHDAQQQKRKKNCPTPKKERKNVAPGGPLSPLPSPLLRHCTHHNTSPDPSNVREGLLPTTLGITAVKKNLLCGARDSARVPAHGDSLTEHREKLSVWRMWAVKAFSYLSRWRILHSNITCSWIFYIVFVVISWNQSVWSENTSYTVL